MNITKRNTHKTTYANIIALLEALVDPVLGVLIGLRVL